MSIYLVIYLSIQSYLYHHHLSFNHLEMFRLVLFINMYLYDYLSYIYLSVYISIYTLFIYLYLSFHSFIYWIIINTFLRTTSRCIESVFCLSVWLRGKICLFIQQFIYLSISSNKSIYLHVYQSSIYIFLKLCETPCNIIFFHVCYLYVL